MNIRKPIDVLIFWQGIYGDLDEHWKNRFLKSELVREIVTFPSENIKVAIRRNRKLVDITQDLRDQDSRKEEFLDKYDKHRNSREVDSREFY